MSSARMLQCIHIKTKDTTRACSQVNGGWQYVRWVEVMGPPLTRHYNSPGLASHHAFTRDNSENILVKLNRSSHHYTEQHILRDGDESLRKGLYKLNMERISEKESIQIEHGR